MERNTPQTTVRKKYKKAYSKKVNFYSPKGNGVEWWIMSGEHKKGEEPTYFPYAMTSPAGFRIAKGKTRNEAWRNAALMV